MNALSIVLDILGAVAITGIGWLLFRGIHSDGKRADDARNQLDAAQAEQRTTQSAIDTVSKRADESAGTAQSIADRVSEAQGAVDAAQGQLDDCQQIIADSARCYEESARILREIRAGARADGGEAADAENSMADRER